MYPNALLSGTEMKREKKIPLEVISILWMQTHSEVFLQNFIMTVRMHLPTGHDLDKFMMFVSSLWKRHAYFLLCWTG